MGVIRFDCPRCGKHLRVSPAKAGRHGRCPTCGGRIKVPNEVPVEKVSGKLEHRHVRLAIAVVVGFLLIVAVAFLAGRGDRNGREDAEGSSVVHHEALLRKLQQVRRRLTQLDDLEGRLAAYKRMALSESELRARDVRRRLNDYEPVSVFECALREQILAGREERINASTGPEIVADEGKLNSPLTTLERERLKQLSDQLEALSAELVEAFRRAHITIRPTPDPLGRRLLNVTETEARIERERTLLRESEADIRRQMMNPVAAAD